MNHCNDSLPPHENPIKNSQNLPPLQLTEWLAFEGSVEFRSMPAGSILFQAQRSGQQDPGRWFGLAKPRNARHAEAMFNINKWGNDGSQIKRFLVLSQLMGYLGRVAGGIGLQFFVPEDITLENSISLF